MKCFVILLAILATETLTLPSGKDLQKKWTNFKKIHQKTYNDSEETARFEVFQGNVKKIEEHNELYEKNEVSYKMVINKFADMTHEEFLVYYSGYRYNSTQSRTTFRKTSVIEIPDEIDWREAGAVTEVKNQGLCGACWAFSVVGALEGQNFLQNGLLVSLSEQELVDCIIQRSVRGCYGGFTDVAYRYVMEHGLSTETDYPYEDEEALCHRNSLPSAVIENGFVSIFGNEEALREAVGTVGPISVGVNTPNWQFYSEGIYYDSTCKSDPNSLNHAVLAVGYGVDNGTEYWLVKNSYGADWGEDGYIRMARNADNNCGLATTPSYPLL